MTLDIRRRQLAAKIGTEGTYDSGVENAANAAITIFDPVADIAQEMHPREPARASLGSVVDVVGARLGKISFKTDIRGSGVAGTIPEVDVLLKACGFAATINTGVAITGAYIDDPRNFGTAGKPNPVSSGTYTHTVSGYVISTLTAVVTDTSATMRHFFFPSDGTVMQEFTTSHTDASAQVIGLGVSVALDNPTSGTTGWRVGDRFRSNWVSDQAVEVSYKPISTGIPVLDMVLYEDGRAKKFHSCRGTFRIVYDQVGNAGKFEFEFTGVKEAIVDVGLLSGIAYFETAPPPFKGVTTTFGGVTPQCFTNLSVDMGNVVTGRQCATDSEGYTSARITSRRVTATIDPEAAVIATDDPYGDQAAGTTEVLALQVGSVSGNIFKLNAPVMQKLEITDTEREGIAIDQLAVLFAEPEFDAGGDYHEVELVFL